MSDLSDKIMAYESGEMNDEKIIELFQGLIDSGLAWRLQGHYGRTASALIEEGHCHRAEEERVQAIHEATKKLEARVKAKKEEV